MAMGRWPVGRRLVGRRLVGRRLLGRRLVGRRPVGRWLLGRRLRNHQTRSGQGLGRDVCRHVHDLTCLTPPAVVLVMLVGRDVQRIETMRRGIRD